MSAGAGDLTHLITRFLSKVMSHAAWPYRVF